ncbi:MAG: leucyl aminopeptidase [Planctomycetota bacterium]|nr:MAG: leucyl aminopeptidase [Planctomycetota bacterium]
MRFAVQIQSLSSSPLETAADALAVGIYEDAPLAGATAEVDKALGGAVRGLIDRKEFSGGSYETAPLLVPMGQAKQALLVGLGKKDAFNTGEAFRCAAAASRALAAKSRSDVAFYLDEGWNAEQSESGVAGALVGCLGQDIHRAEKKRHPFQTIHWSTKNAAAIDSGRILGNAVNLTRNLVNSPADEIYPETFALRAAEVAENHGLEIEVWDEKKLAAEKCNALLAVAKGSSRPARLVILKYNGGGKGDSPLAIVGKGVTFDSGGLSLKPSEAMLTMKCDKAGACTMLGAVQAIAALKLPINVIGIAGLVENMTGPAAMKLGDVLTARNGRTIEVHNTDAEGRLVLADALDVAVELGAEHIIDLATLTGAVIVALGMEVAGLMTNDPPWCDAVAGAARKVGEPVWELPMYPEIYDDLIKSEVADIKNVGEGRWAGAITAAKFLEQFIGDTSWTHIDLAGPAFREKPRPWIDAGGSGQYVRTLVEVARAWKK